MEGIGIFTPSIKLDGRIRINFRINRRLQERLNMSGAFTGEFKNRENIGKTMVELEAEVGGLPWILA